MAKLVSKVYGDALFEIAAEKNSLDIMYEQILSLKEVFEANQELMLLLSNPQVVRSEKLSVLRVIFEKNITGELMSFLLLVVEKDRQRDLLAIFQYVIHQMKEYQRIGTAYISTAVELEEVQKQQVQERLLATTDYSSFELSYQVDPTLIGGMVIRIGDRVVDGSIRTQLYELKKSLG